MSGNKAAQAELFLALADFWKPPDPEFWESIADGTFDDEFMELALQAGYMKVNSPTLRFQNFLPHQAALQSYFVRCFIGIGKKSALPVESVYKKWTEDGTVRLPIASSTGYLMGDSALHVRYLLDYYGFAIPPDYRMMPDHLTLLLELASYLLKHRTEEETQTFFSQHLDWLDQFGKAFFDIEPENEADRQSQNFYRLALQRTGQCVECELGKNRKTRQNRLHSKLHN